MNMAQNKEGINKTYPQFCISNNQGLRRKYQDADIRQLDSNEKNINRSKRQNQRLEHSQVSNTTNKYYNDYIFRKYISKNPSQINGITQYGRVNNLLGDNGKQPNLPIKSYSKSRSRSNPLEINRYMKQYYYNSYKINQKIKQNQKVINQSITKENVGYSVTQNKKTTISQKKNLDKTKSRNKYNQNAFIQGSDDLVQLQNDYNKQNKPLRNNLCNNNMNYTQLSYNLESHMKSLLQENRLLKIKNLEYSSHILQLEVQIKEILSQNSESHLKIQLLQERIKDFETQIAHLNVQLREMQENMHRLKNIEAKTQLFFQEMNKIEKNHQFSLVSQNLDGNFQYLKNQLLRLNSYKQFKNNLSQMKNKIENLQIDRHFYQFSNKQYGQKQDHEGNKRIDQFIELQNLWKWVKKIGRQYSLLKKKMVQIQNESIHLC